MRTKFIYLLFVSAMFYNIGCSYLNSSDKAVVHGALPQGFDTLNREAQILVCASCHKAEYENEMLGPHSRAYTGMMQLSDYVNAEQYDCDFYREHVNNTANTACIACHATDNMFETIFNDNAKEKHKGKLPAARKDKSSLITGVDCLTCHFDGQRVIGSTQNLALSENGCAPVYNSKLASNLGCKPCHFSNWVADDKTYYGELSNEVSCLSCHQQYDASGKPTHYIYNRFRASDSVYNKLIEAFFLPQIITKTSKGLRVVWQNTAMPHKFSEGPENIIRLTAYTANNMVVAKGSIYLNQKTAHDEAMLGVYNNRRLAGTLGYNPVYKEMVVDTVFNFLPGSSAVTTQKLRVEVEGFNKGQYWFSDTIAHARFRKTIFL